MKARLVSLSAAALLAVAYAAPASADVVSEGFSVAYSLTVTGVPASLTYDIGGAPLGAGQKSDNEQFTVNVSANSDVNMAFSGEAFVGAETLSQDIRELRFGAPSDASLGTGLTASEWYDTTALEAVDPVITFGGNSSSVIVDAHVDLLGLDPAPGAYSGSFELVFSQ